MKTFQKISVILLHVVLILLAYSSFVWLDWKLVIVGVGLYYMQLLVFGWCVLSLAQFDREKISFHEWYLTKLGIKVNRKRLNFALTWIIPFVIVGLAVIVQVGLHFAPLIRT